MKITSFHDPAECMIRHSLSRLHAGVHQPKAHKKKNQNLKHTNFPGKENHQNVSTKQATLTFADLQAITFGDKRGRIPPFQNNAHIRAKT
jgi:hypothetical protein